MTKHVVFIQGGAGQEDFNADKKMVDSLKSLLGSEYNIHYPCLPEEASPDFGRMNQIQNAIASADGELFLVGHSLGASMLLKYLSENKTSKNILGVFLLATPFWQGDEKWKDGLKLRSDFAEHLPKGPAFYFYHCRDDEEVPVHHMNDYARAMPNGVFRKIDTGGHQFGNDLSLVAADMLNCEKAL